MEGRTKNAETFTANQLEDNGVKYAWGGAMYESSGG